MSSNGRLILDLRAGETLHAFKAAVLRTLSTTPAASQSISNTAVNSSQGSDNYTNPQGDVEAQLASQVALPTTTAGPNSASESTDDATIEALESSEASDDRELLNPIVNSARRSAVESLLAERRIRLEKDKASKEAAEKAARKSKAEERKAAMGSDPSSAKAKQMTYAQQQRYRQSEAKHEKDRIIRQIELDKLERREKEEQRKALAMAEAESKEVIEDSPLDCDASKTRDRVTGSRDCALQVRLFDGSRIRKRFPPNYTLSKDVRHWVDEQRPNGDAPYIFKQILTPLPNRTLSIVEEEDTLQNLELIPSATLVLVPVQGYIAAYEGNQGYLARGASAGYNIFSAGVGIITGALGTFLGVGRLGTHQQERPGVEHEDVGASKEQRPHSVPSGINIRTLRDQRNDRDRYQLYNGNQVGHIPYERVLTDISSSISSHVRMTRRTKNRGSRSSPFKRRLVSVALSSMLTLSKARCIYIRAILAVLAAHR